MSGRDQAKLLILQLVAGAGPDGFVGTLRIFKAFYYANLFHLAEGGAPLAKWDVVRMPMGPGIDKGDELIAELVCEGRLVATPMHVGPYPTKRFQVGPRARDEDMRPKDADRLSAVIRAAEHVASKSTTQLTAETHEFSRSWRSTQDGDPLDLFLDVMTDEEVERGRAEARESRDFVAGFFATS